MLNLSSLSKEFSKLCHVNVDSNNHIMSEILNHEPVIVDSPEKTKILKVMKFGRRKLLILTPNGSKNRQDLEKFSA